MTSPRTTEATSLSDSISGEFKPSSARSLVCLAVDQISVALPQALKSLCERDKETERDGGMEEMRKRVTNGSLSLSLSEI